MLAVPIADPPDGGRDKKRTRLGRGDGLRGGEYQRDVAIDALGLKLAHGLDPFPRRGDLDEDAVLRNVQSAQLVDRKTRLADSGPPIEGQRRAGLDGNPAGNQLCHLSRQQRGDTPRRAMRDALALARPAHRPDTCLPHELRRSSIPRGCQDE
jgi:hypothetical protein